LISVSERGPLKGPFFFSLLESFFSLIKNRSIPKSVDECLTRLQFPNLSGEAVSMENFMVILLGRQKRVAEVFFLPPLRRRSFGRREEVRE
jgi:hypothetical protein